MLASLLLLLTPVKPPAKFNPTLGGYFAITSASQCQDAEKRAAWFSVFSILVEKYGAVGTLKDRKFHPEMECTYGELLMGVDRLLDAIVDKIAETGDEATQSRKLGAVFAILQKNAGAFAPIKGLKDTSPYYENVRSVVERYGLFVGTNPAAYSDYAVVTRKELGEFGFRLFGDTAFQLKAKALPTVAASRADMLSVLATGAARLENAIAGK